MIPTKEFFYGKRNTFFLLIFQTVSTAFNHFLLFYIFYLAKIMFVGIAYYKFYCYNIMRAIFNVNYTWFLRHLMQWKYEEKENHHHGDYVNSLSNLYRVFQNISSEFFYRIYWNNKKTNLKEIFNILHLENESVSDKGLHLLIYCLDIWLRKKLIN